MILTANDRKIVKHRLIEEEMNQTNLAEQLGVTSTFISLVLNGQKVVPESWASNDKTPLWLRMIIAEKLHEHHSNKANEFMELLLGCLSESDHRSYVQQTFQSLVT